MICHNCKQDMKENDMFCPICGAKADNSTETIHNSSISKNNKRKLPLVTLLLTGISVLSILLILVLISKIEANHGSDSSRYFKSPDACVEYFIGCLRKNDIDGAIQAFAVKDIVKNYDFKANINRLRCFNPVTMMAPEYTDYAEINQTILKGDAARSIKLFVYCLLNDEDFSKSEIMIESPENVDELYNQLNPAKIKDISLERMDYANREMQSSKIYKKNAREIADIYGFVDSEEYLALYKFNDNYYYSGFNLIKFKKGWKIYQLGSPLVGTTPGEVIAASKEEYLDLIE